MKTEVITLRQLTDELAGINVGQDTLRKWTSRSNFEKHRVVGHRSMFYDTPKFREELNDVMEFLKTSNVVRRRDWSYVVKERKN